VIRCILRAEVLTVAANRRTVGPKKGGGWQVSGGGSAGEFRTQGEAVMSARQDLLSAGGGELVVKGRDGKVRAQDTIRRKDPRGTKG
jgi:hypothetical protein